MLLNDLDNAATVQSEELLREIARDCVSVPGLTRRIKHRGEVDRDEALADLFEALEHIGNQMECCEWW
jgi:hypothetical protein